MAEWLGNFIANWPLWATIIALLIVAVIGFIYVVSIGGAELPWKKKEWWQDKDKVQKNKVKKG